MSQGLDVKVGGAIVTVTVRSLPGGEFEYKIDGADVTPPGPIEFLDSQGRVVHSCSVV
ncbi:MAG: hypothetical protein R3F20_06500 [Planctomycetota bacterium]